MIDRVWPEREKLVHFSLAYTPSQEFITKSEVTCIMEEQNRIFLKSIEMPVNKIVVPAQQAPALKPAISSNQRTREVEPVNTDQRLKLSEMIRSKPQGPDGVHLRHGPVITSNLTIKESWP